MGQSQSREIHVTFEEHKRWVPVRDDTYEALLDGFISTFKDVFVVSEEEVRETVLFQKYDPKCGDFVDIKPDESTAGIQKVRAVSVTLSRIGTSYPLMDNNIYNLWSFGSYQGNSFLRRINDQTLLADGDGKTAECEWLAKQVRTEEIIYWIFSNSDNTKVLAVENGQVVLKDSGSAGTSSQFLPSLNGRYQCLSPRDDTQGNFLGAEGDGSVKLILNKEAHPAKKRYNPCPQTLFIPYFLRTK